MNFESEGEYNNYMQAQGEAEQEAQMRQEYHEYLDSLIDDKKYELHAIEVVQDLINLKWNGKDDVKEFLSMEKTKLMIPTLIKSDPF
jgi:hypothetical protein